MFNLFKKSIPAPEHQRAALVQQLFLARCNSDPEAMRIAKEEGFHPRDIDPAQLMQAAPEATILRIVEPYLLMKDQGADDDLAVHHINQLQSSQLATIGIHMPVLSIGSSLMSYIRHNIDINHGYGAGISDNFLEYAVQQIRAFYKR